MSLLDKASLVVTPNAVKAGKLYSVIPNTTLGDMTVVRATTATRVNSLGLIESVAVNAPRIDYTNGSCPSILVEGQRTNLVLRSEEFNNAAWSKFGSTISFNSIVSPDGANNADKIIEDLTLSRHFVSQSAILPVGQSILSVFAKQGERKNIGIGNASVAEYAVFDLSNGTLVSVSGATMSNPKIQNYGNGWYRISVENNRASISTFGIVTANDLGLVNYLGNGTSGVYVWGAQVEAGSYATSYIPTVASTVTRNADLISKTGISSLIGQTEGTMFLNLKYLTSTNFESDVRLNDGTANNTVSLFNSGLTPFVSIKSNNVQQVSFGLSPFTINSNQKIAITYKNNEFKVYQNGVLKLNQLTGNAPLNLSSLILSDGFRINALNSVQLYKTALSSTELTQLTTL